METKKNGLLWVRLKLFLHVRRDGKLTVSEIEWLFELDDMGGRGICEDSQAKDCTGNQY
jgi:hypothetical protein